MSWDSYIDNLIGHANGSTDKVAIISLADGSSWTSHTHPNAMKISPAEGKVIATAMEKEDSSAFVNGVHLEGLKYQFLRMNDGFLLAKKKDNGSITMQKSKTAIVISHTAEGKQPGDSNKAVGIIAEYLEGNSM